jgi:TPP-dependent trihydroxycyclohexane-1,2-dione (THcHDO) dehydratase
MPFMGSDAKGSPNGSPDRRAASPAEPGATTVEVATTAGAQELNGGWRAGALPVATAMTSGATMDLEYGFSCMGYEIAGPWGASNARSRTHPGGLVTALLGDGSYLMLNSELYSAAFAGHPFVAVV